MKVAHTADNHLGYAQYHLRERKEDFFKAFEKVVDRCIEEGVELLLHAGDLFESYHPDTETIYRAIGQFRRLKEAGVKVVAITGNHDRALRKGIFPPQKILEELGLLTLLDPFGEVEFDGLSIFGFRYLPRRYFEEFKDGKLREFEERALRRNSPSVLLFHQAIDQYLPFKDAFEVLLTELPSGFSYYAAGHIHLPRLEEVKGGKLAYPGSTEFRSLMEAQRGLRGFNIYHPETGEVERVELDGLRPFIVVKTTQERAPSDLRELLERVKSCSQRPVVVLIYSFKELPVEKFSELLAQIEKFSLYLKVVKRPVLEEAAEEGEVRGKSFHQLFEEFAKELGLSERVKKLSWEVVDAPPERVEEVVESFLKRELRELHSILEEWGE